MNKTALTLPQIGGHLTPEQFMHACEPLGVNPLHALKDPVTALRTVAGADLETGNEFLRRVLPPGNQMDLYEVSRRYLSEDTALLMLCSVFAIMVNRLRKISRGGRVQPRDPERAMPGVPRRRRGA